MAHIDGEDPPMPERFIHHLRVERPAASEDVVAARDRLREKFPRVALRRMTHLGMLLGASLDGLALTPADAIVYASNYGETRALEDYLATFPSASPLLFQTSIHPGGVQQVLIGRQQPVGRFWPAAGGARIVEQALISSLLEPAERVVLLGGEERGTWLLEAGMASERAFGFAAALTRDRANAIGRIAFAGGSGGSPADSVVGDAETGAERCPALAEFADALAERRPLRWSGVGGTWELDWCHE